LQHTIGRHRSDGVFPRAQRHQRFDQRLGMQPDQMGEAVRQLAFGQGFAQAHRLAIERHRLEAVETGVLQPGQHARRGMAWMNFQDVAGLPGDLRRRRQAEEEHRRALTARVEQTPLDQRPALPGRLFETNRRGAGQLAQFLLPLLQSSLVGAVDLNAVEQALRPLQTQPVVDPSGEAAEVLVLPVTQRQHGIAQLFERHRAAEHLALKTLCGVRRLAVTEGADHEKRLLRLAQAVGIDTRQRLDPHRNTRGLQLPGALPGQLFGETALAGKTDQPAFTRVIRFQRTARSQRRTLLAPAIQVQQPASDEEQRHSASGQHHQDTARHTEVLADMQGIDAGQQLRLEALLGVAFMAADFAAFRVDLKLVDGAHMLGAIEHVEDGRRLSCYRRQAQIPGQQLGPGGLLDALPHGVIVDFGSGAIGRFTTTATTPFSALFRWRIGEHACQPLAIPVIGPVQPREPGAEVEQQRPGAGNCVQIPIEAAALLLPVQGQPGAPTERLARPTQIEAGKAEEDQRQGAGSRDLLAHLAHGQEAVQHQHQLEEVLADRLGQHLTGVRVEDDARAAPLTR